MDKTERELRDMLEDRRLVRWPTEPQWVAIWTAANAQGYTGTVSAAVHSIAPDLLDVDWARMMLKADAESAKMMWSEIRVRRSVSPFRRDRPPTAFNPGASQADVDQEAATTLQQKIAALVSQRWEVISDGPTGVQLRAPKKLRKLDWLCLALGLVCLGLGFRTAIFYGLGLILVGIALLDYAVLTKAETKFLPRA